MFPVTKVVLFKHGVALFERAGSIEGDQDIDLRFEASAMDDVLKSLVVTDMGDGSISNISYESTTDTDKSQGSCRNSCYVSVT